MTPEMNMMLAGSVSWRISAGERSYDIVDDALKILENLKHRGGEGADQKSGDGAGILTQIPHDFFHRECEVLGFSLPPEGSTASA